MLGNCYFVLNGLLKRGRGKSHFDMPKYAEINKVASSPNIMRYGHMDESGIGTDCCTLSLVALIKR